MNPAFNTLSVSQLTALATILEVRNLSRAAEVLGSSQPILSRHLAHFRQALDDPLLVHRRREYVLTVRACRPGGAGGVSGEAEAHCGYS